MAPKNKLKITKLRKPKVVKTAKEFLVPEVEEKFINEFAFAIASIARSLVK